MMTDRGDSYEGPPLLLRGLASRSTITDCPYGAFKVHVSHCSGKGECADVCIVDVFDRNERGECTVVNEVLCFGCMACVAQCTEGGVTVVPNDDTAIPSIEEILR